MVNNNSNFHLGTPSEIKLKNRLNDINISISSENDYSELKLEIEGLILDASERGSKEIENSLKNLLDELEHEHNSFIKLQERLEAPYEISPELEDVIEVCKILGKPLLIQGEPGTGKTALAYYLAGQEGSVITHTTCNSNTSLEDLLYSVDNLQRLTDSQLGENTNDISKYIKLGDLGNVILECSLLSENDSRPILLIDEVDKTSDDVLNDILDQLEHLQFRIKETGKIYSAGNVKPIIIFTSNAEKELPYAFLRRCAMHEISFPNPEELKNIILKHLPDLLEETIEKYLEIFYSIRDMEGIEKKPSTSEVLDWMEVLYKEFKLGKYKRFGYETIYDLSGVELSLLLKNSKDLNLLKKKPEEEILREEKFPESINALLKGKKVFSLTSTDEKFRLGLFNSGINFSSMGGGLEIYGLENLGNGKYASNEELYSKLENMGGIRGKYIRKKMDLDLNSINITYSNDEYAIGVIKSDYSQESIIIYKDNTVDEFIDI